MRTKPTPGEPLGPCLICGAPATELHHIIPRACGEDWPMNLAPLCKKCHTRWHSEGPRRACGMSDDAPEEAPYELVWQRMDYDPLELTVLCYVACHIAARHYPRVLHRGNWAGREYQNGDQLDDEWAGIVRSKVVEGIDGDWGPLLRLVPGPPPRWTGGWA